HPAHLATDELELAEHRVRDIAILVEVGAPGVRDAIELLCALGGDARVADFFEPGECGIDHPRAPAVKAAPALLQRLAELVTVTRLLFEQSKQHQLQIARSQTASGAECAATHTHTSRESRRKRPETPSVPTRKVVTPAARVFVIPMHGIDSLCSQIYL